MVGTIGGITAPLAGDLELLLQLLFFFFPVHLEDGGDFSFSVSLL